MTNYYYTKTTEKRKIRKYIRFFGLSLSLVGLSTLLYFGLPISASYLMLEHVYASQNITTPIPAIRVLTAQRIQNILTSTMENVEHVDYSDAKTWFPSFEINPATPRVKGYTLSIPKLHITDAYVTTQDYNVGAHLVNYGGTAVPPDKGNAVIFGHSTLPQLFNPQDYKTIFARLHTIDIGDSINVTVDSSTYTYEVFGIDIISPTDFDSLTQNYDHSYLTLITCTPPGTTFERLVVKAKLKK